jgi:uncharacterized protein YjlB
MPYPIVNKAIAFNKLLVAKNEAIVEGMPYGTEKKRRKWKEEFTVQGNYGQGWEDVTSEDTYSEARERLREYRENEINYPHRIVTRRVLNDGT